MEFSAGREAQVTETTGKLVDSSRLLYRSVSSFLRLHGRLCQYSGELCVLKVYPLFVVGFCHNIAFRMAEPKSVWCLLFRFSVVSALQRGLPSVWDLVVFPRRQAPPFPRGSVEPNPIQQHTFTVLTSTQYGGIIYLRNVYNSMQRSWRKVDTTNKPPKKKISYVFQRNFLKRQPFCTLHQTRMPLTGNRVSLSAIQ